MFEIDSKGMVNVGAVLAPDGLIYAIPSNAPDVLVINPETEEVCSVVGGSRIAIEVELKRC